MATTKNNPEINSEDIILSEKMGNSWQQWLSKAGHKLITGASMTLFGYEMGHTGNDNKETVKYSDNYHHETVQYPNVPKNDHDDLTVREVFVYGLVVLLLFFGAMAIKHFFSNKQRRRNESMQLVDVTNDV